MVRMVHPTDMAIPECHDFATHQSFPVYIACMAVLLDNFAKATPYDYGFQMMDIEASMKAFPLMSLTAGVKYPRFPHLVCL